MDYEFGHGITKNADTWAKKTSLSIRWSFGCTCYLFVYPHYINTLILICFSMEAFVFQL